MSIALTLSGCGGGSSGGAGSPVAVTPTPVPTPTPTPTPTPASVLPPAPFLLAASQAFDVEGWIGNDAVAIPLEQTNFAFAWSATERTYLSTHPEAGAGRLEYTFPGRNPFAFSLVRDGATVPIHFSVNPSRLASGEASFERADTAPAEWQNGKFAFGVPTPAAAIPVTGTLRFGGPVSEGSAVDRTIDFGSNTVSGSIYAAVDDAWGPYEPVRYDLPSVPFDRATGRFAFKAASVRAPLSIELAGRLAGPQAREIIVRYDAPAFHPFDEVWVRAPQADAVSGR